MTLYLIQAECVEYLETLSAKSIDIIVTSPPYNIGINYNTYSDDDPEYERHIECLFAQLHRVLKIEGSFFLNVAGTCTNPLLPYRVLQIATGYFTLQNNILWVKSLSLGETTHGHFKPINSDRYLNHNHEHIFHFVKARHPVDRLAIGVPFTDKTNIARRGHAQDLRCAGNVWYIPYETVQSKTEKFNHPAGFPVELPWRCLKLHGVDVQSLVLDPYVGAGTTLVAAQRLGCNGIGIDIDPVYLDSARKRLGL